MIHYHNTNLLALAAAGLVFAVITVPGLRTFLDSAIPQFLGRISFALYLVHLPLVLSVIAWGYLHFNCLMGLKFFLGLFAFLALAIVLAWGITITVDEPLVRVLHRLKKYRGFVRNPDVVAL
jgi:peptidoglycan/LPS O-acetylase OafA/YrhL